MNHIDKRIQFHYNPYNPTRSVGFNPNEEREPE